MNVYFEAALRYIDLGSYDKAIEKLKTAIDMESKDPETQTQYRCVLGELYANLHMVEESREEFNKVLDYCQESHTLQKQKAIAQTYIDAFDGKLKMPEEKQKRPGDAPLVPKPRQNAAFIAKQARRKH